VVIADDCPTHAAGSADIREVFGLAAPALSFLTGVGIDLLRSGLDTVANALENASRERAIGGQGTANFHFYSLAAAANQVELSDRLKAGDAACLVISIDARSDQPPSTIVSELPDIPDEVRIGGTNALRAVYVEAVLRSNGDSFVVLPNYVWYGQALRGLPNSAVPVELHVEFSVPGAGANAGEVFAISRVPLPPMVPNLSGTSVFTSNELEGYSSAALPLRPTTGAVDTFRQSVTAAYSAIETAEASLSEERRKLAHAQDDFRRIQQPTDEARALVRQHERQVDLLIERLAQARAQAALRLPEGQPKTLGSTNLTARIAFIRQPNRFGLALAQALRTRGPTLATNLETAITSRINRSDWTAEHSTFVSSMGQVRAAQAAYDLAMAGTDAAVQLEKLNALRNAQATANGAAAALGIGMPFPQLLQQLAQ
jgi:hypothetical protein